MRLQRKQTCSNARSSKCKQTQVWRPLEHGSSVAVIALNALFVLQALGLANSGWYPSRNSSSSRVHYSWIITENSLPLSNLSDLPSFRREWGVLLECASPGFVARRLAELARSADWAELLPLAQEHGVLGHLAVRLRGLDENLVPAEIMQMLLEHHRIRSSPH